MWRANSLEKTLRLGKIEGRRRERQRMRQWHYVTDSVDMSLSKLRKIVKDREAWCAAVHGVTKRWIQLNNKVHKSLWSLSLLRFHLFPWTFSIYFSYYFFFQFYWDIIDILYCVSLRCIMQQTQEMRVWSLDWEDPLEKETATHSGILAWKIPWTKGPGRL